jgi:GT2 family glycosyltransferase
VVDFSIILVNFNGMKYLPSCLEAIRKQKFEGSWEIIAINNFSTDNSVEWLREQQDVKVLDFEKNLGFSAANNKGIFQSTGEFILCLNFDCFLTPHFLQAVYTAFQENPDVGMISGKLYKLIDFKETTWLDSTGIGFERCFPRDRGEWENDNGQYDNQQDIFGPTGAAACYRKSALESVKFNESEYFDEEMFIYVEDIDLAWRLNLAGWKGRYLPQAVGYHQRGSTREKNSKEQKNYFVGGFANRLYTMLKNLRTNEGINPYWRQIIIQEIKFYFSWGGLVPRNHLIYLQAVLHFLNLSTRSKTWKKRRFIQENTRGNHLGLGFDSPHYRCSGTTTPFDYNIVNKINIQDYEEIYTVSKTDISLTNIIKQHHNGGKLIEGVSSTDDPQITIQLPKKVSDNLPSVFLSMRVFMDEDHCGQFIYFDKKGSFIISDNFLLQKGYHDYFFCVRTMPIHPRQTSFLWENGCENFRFDPTLKAKANFKIDFIKILLKKDHPNVG